MRFYKLLSFIKHKHNSIRLISINHSCNCNKSRKEIKCSAALKEAERVVGYPTSFLSLRWILNDEMANIASHIRKLLGTNHPLLQIAKDLLLRNHLPTWGLIVLLVSKMAGLNSKVAKVDFDMTAGILHSQRILAEVTEMIKTSNMVHKGLITIDSPTEQEANDLYFGNKLALLCGDYLLSTSFNEIARLKNFEMQELISTSLRDLAEAEFIGIRNRNNQPFPSKPLSVQNDVTIPNEFGLNPYQMKGVLGNMKAEWVLRNILGGGSLLGKCCQCSLILAKHNRITQEYGYLFGRNLALAWQACLEKNIFLDGSSFSLVSAPVMFHLQDDQSLYEEIAKGAEDCDAIDYNFIKKSVISGAGLEKTSRIQEEFSKNALSVLEKFPNNESKDALVNIIMSM